MKSFTQYISEIFTPPKKHIKGGYHPDLGRGGGIALERTTPHNYYNKEHGIHTRGAGFEYDTLPKHHYNELRKKMRGKNGEGVNIADLHSGIGARIDFSVEEEDLSEPGKKVQVFKKEEPGKTFPTHIARTVFDHIHHFINSHNVNHIFYNATGDPDGKKSKLYQRAAKRLGVGATNIAGLKIAESLGF
jgi:hypothetical protein